jgi:hypothetical protein
MHPGAPGRNDSRVFACIHPTGFVHKSAQLCTTKNAVDPLFQTNEATYKKLASFRKNATGAKLIPYR